MSGQTSADKVEEELMIRLTRLNRAPMVLNADLIEHIDVTPDTVITLTTGQILRVRETAEEVVRRIVDFRRCILSTSGDTGGLCNMADLACRLEPPLLSEDDGSPAETEDPN
jgi:flagellar protein FlbD